MGVKAGRSQTQTQHKTKTKNNHTLSSRKHGSEAFENHQILRVLVEEFLQIRQRRPK